MADHSYFRWQFIVFALVSASFKNIYITKPLLPVLQREFSADMVLVSFSVSAVILGIALSPKCSKNFLCFGVFSLRLESVRTVAFPTAIRPCLNLNPSVA
jgi:MFS family permease